MFGIKILTRAIWRESLFFTGICLSLFTIILFTVQMLRLASLVINRGVELSQIGVIAIAIVPTFLEIAFPLASLLGMMLAFARFSGDSELVIMRASGLSYAQLIRPVIALAIIFGVITLGISLVLKPWGYSTLNATLLDIARSKSTAALEPGAFAKLGDLTVYCEDINTETGEAKKILIEDRRIPSQSKLILAHHGEIRSDPRNMAVLLNLYDGEFHERADKRYFVTRFDTNSIAISSAEVFDESKSKGQSARELTATQLNSSIDQLTSIKQSLNEGAKLAPTDLPADLQKQFRGQEINLKTVTKRIIRNQVELGFRYSIPTACALLAILGMLLGVQPSRMQRAWGGGLSLMLGMLVFVVYYGLLSVGITLAESGKLSPAVGVWGPVAILALITFITARKLHQERWSSIIEGLISSLRFLRKKG